VIFKAARKAGSMPAWTPFCRETGGSARMAGTRQGRGGAAIGLYEGR